MFFVFFVFDIENGASYGKDFWQGSRMANEQANCISLMGIVDGIMFMHYNLINQDLEIFHE